MKKHVINKKNSKVSLYWPLIQDLQSDAQATVTTKRHTIVYFNPLLQAGRYTVSISTADYDLDILHT